MNDKVKILVPFGCVNQIAFDLGISILTVRKALAGWSKEYDQIREVAIKKYGGVEQRCRMSPASAENAPEMQQV